MVEHRYGDNAEAAPAQGSTDLLKRLRQGKTTQTCKTPFSSAVRRVSRSRKRMAVRPWDGKRTRACEYVHRMCVCVGRTPKNLSPGAVEGSYV